MNEILFREFRHLCAANGTDSSKHVSALYGFFFGNCTVVNGALLFTFDAEHFHHFLLPPPLE